MKIRRDAADRRDTSQAEEWRMTQTLDQQLSALLDGELPEEQYDMLLRRLDAEPEMRERFARYSLIGDVLKDAELQVGALQIADRVRDQISASDVDVPMRSPAARPGIAPGLLGAGIAAAAAFIVALNLNPSFDEAASPELATLASVATTAPEAGVYDSARRARANVAPERMTRYLVSHARYENAASRQFVDSHIVMPAFQRVAWQSSGVRQ